jgi:hypothetical protein
MKGPLAPGDVWNAPFDYYAAVDKVNTKLDGTNNITQATKTYCRAVMAYLPTHAAPLKASFVTDMKQDADLNVFVNANRANDVQKRCVDDALNRARALKSPGHPVGEKYDWEIPYIMSFAQWPIASGGAVAWVDLSTFLGRCAAGTQYVVMTRLRGQPHGHTILITKIGETLWISDKQEQNYDYSKCECIAWSRPGTVTSGDVPKPKIEITEAGKFDGDWDNS